MTQQRDDEPELSLSNPLAKAILESAIDYGIISMTLDGLITSWNKGATLILGWTEPEMLGRPAGTFFTELDNSLEVPAKEMGLALLNGRGVDERWHRRKDGSLFWANGEMMPLLNAAGEPQGFIKILRDRTSQRLDFERQRAEAEFTKSILASSADCIVVLDLEGNTQFVSPGGIEAMEVSDVGAIIGLSWLRVWTGSDQDDARAAVRAAREGGIGRFQGYCPTHRGTPKWWDVVISSLPGADGKPERLLSVGRDITNQKMVEDTLATSETRWRDLFTGMQEGFFLAELKRSDDGHPVDFLILEVNSAFARQSGLKGDVVGCLIRALAPDIPQELIENCALTVDQDEARSFEVLAGHRWFEVRTNSAGGQRFTCLFFDISQRKRNEERGAAILELGDRLRDITAAKEAGSIASEILGRTLKLSHAGFGTVDQERETVDIAQDWAISGHAALDGTHPLRAYGTFIEELKLGRTVLVNDTEEDPRTSANTAALEALGVRALANLPVFERGRFVSLFFALKSMPHRWHPDEIEFLRNVADRTRAAIARIEAEEQQRMLNLELSHRMKNMLTMVQAIASQTMRGATDILAAQDVLSARLIALGNANDFLLGRASGSSSLSIVIDTALQSHRDRPDRFVMRGHHLDIGAPAALSISLILHELATNATKYGALSSSEGTVVIEWETSSGPDETELKLVWTEMGGPPVTAPSRKGFGSRLIERGLTAGFDGKVTLAYPKEGAVCTILAPVRALQAS